jgi:catalase
MLEFQPCQVDAP